MKKDLKISSLFPPLSPPHPTEKKLNNVRKWPISGEFGATEGDVKWAEKAVKSLVKKLKKNKTLEELEKAVLNHDSATQCTTIPRSLDGRLQVSSKKTLPHFFYCKVWRYPELQSHHELKCVSNCEYAFSKKLDLVCINPYHYDKVAPPALPTIMVPRGTASSRSGTRDSTADAAVESVQREIDGIALQLQQDRAAAAGNRCGDDDDDNSPAATASPSGQVNLAALEEALFPPNRAAALHSALESPSGGAGGYVSEDADMNENSPQPVAPHVQSPFAALSPYNAGNVLDYAPVNYQEPQFWASIFYYELNQRVGEAFHASVPAVIVDGGCCPSDATRFCLGALSNINRPPTVTEARRHIGRGTRFYYVGGEVYAENLSESAIFVQSPNCNLNHRYDLGTVCRIPRGANMRIFNNQLFAQFLNSSVSKGYEAVYALQRMCHIRVSFVKGWGADYRRQLITATPCWIEIHLNGALQWLDRVLRTMEQPGNINSHT